MRQKGFTLIELMIVIAIIAIIAAIAIPNLLENRKLANEQAAKALLQRILDAQASYNTRSGGSYADSMSRLVEAKFLQEDAFTAVTADNGTATVQGYIFTQQGWTATTWTVTASPIDANTGTKVYTVDSNGKITDTTTG